MFMAQMADNITSNLTSFQSNFSTSGYDNGNGPNLSSGFKMRNIIIGTIGVLINGIAFLAVAKSSKVSEGRKISLLNLIISDVLLMLGMIVYGVADSTHLSGTKSCVGLITTLMVSIVSSYTIALQISFFTFLAVYKVFQYTLLVTSKNTCIILTVIWSVSIISCITVTTYEVSPGKTCAPIAVIHRIPLTILCIILTISFIGVMVLNLYVFVKIKSNRKHLFRGAKSKNNTRPPFHPQKAPIQVESNGSQGNVLAQEETRVVLEMVSTQTDIGVAQALTSAQTYNDTLPITASTERNMQMLPENIYDHIKTRQTQSSPAPKPEIYESSFKKLSKKNFKNKVEPLEHTSQANTSKETINNDTPSNVNVKRTYDKTSLGTDKPQTCEFVQKANVPMTLVQATHKAHLVVPRAYKPAMMTPNTSQNTSSSSCNGSLEEPMASSRKPLTVDKLRKTLLVLTTYSCLLTLPSVIYLICIITYVIDDPEAMVSTPLGIFVSSCPTVRACINPFFYVFKFVKWRELIDKTKRRCTTCHNGI